MATEHTITANASSRPDGKMTIGELRTFLASIPQTADNNAVAPKVRTTMSGHVKSVSATVSTVYVPQEDEGS